MGKTSDIKYNGKRKQLLLKIDENEYVSNLNLGMYDLTTYYTKRDDESLIDKFLQYKNETRQITHLKNDKYYFMPEQAELLSLIKEKQKIIISAPTSFGKTLIIKEYIYKNKPSNIVYIVPTNALAYELENDFKNNAAFSDYIIFDKNKDITLNVQNANMMFIGTQEKLMEIIESFDKIDLFVIDEAYKLQETTSKQRGYKLSEAFLESFQRKSKQIILLTPNAYLKGFEKFDFYEYHTKFNAVDKMFHILSKESFYEELYTKARIDKTILFCSSPSDMVKIAEDAPNISRNTDDDFVAYLENEFHPDWSVIKLLKKGILTHHGIMPKYVQNKMIRRFINIDKFKLLIGTNSISEGINTPTKNLFFNIDCDPTKDKLLYKNTIGRAGRLGKYPIGHIYSTSDMSFLDNEIVEIELAVSKKEEKDEVEDSKNIQKIKALCQNYNIDENVYNEKISTLKLPISKIKRILDVLVEDLKYPGISNLPYMAYKVFKEEYEPYRLDVDRIYIRGTLQQYYNYNNIQKPIRNFSDKIDFFKFNYTKRELTNSEIVEGYMRFTYNTLEYLILPIMNVGKTIKESLYNWNFGENVLDTIKDFFERYFNVFYGFNLDNFDDNKKKIIITLKEYGISLINIGINKDMLEEIELELNSRFSTYDVINSIRKLSLKSNRFSEIYRYILKNYVD